MKKFILMITAAVLCIAVLTACEKSGAGSNDLEKSRYPSAKTAVFVELSDDACFLTEPGGIYPIGFDEINFYVRCQSRSQYYYGEGDPNVLEVRIDGEWYAVPYKKDHWKAGAFALGRGTMSTITFKREDFDYDFKAGEYRYILSITAEGDTSEPLIVYPFRLYDSYPYGDISADDVECCYVWSVHESAQMTDEQTEKLLEIVRKIKLKNDSRIRENDYLGAGASFTIRLKNGENICISCLPKKDEFIIKRYIYEALDSKTEELEELYKSIPK